MIHKPGPQHTSPWFKTTGSPYVIMIHSHCLSIAHHDSHPLAQHSTSWFNNTFQSSISRVLKRDKLQQWCQIGDYIDDATLLWYYTWCFQYKNTLRVHFNILWTTQYVYIQVGTRNMLYIIALPLSTFLLFDFGTVPTVWYFLFSFFYMYIVLCRSLFEPTDRWTLHAYFDNNLNIAMNLSIS
jgi:hypothetical protein